MLCYSGRVGLRQRREQGASQILAGVLRMPDQTSAGNGSCSCPGEKVSQWDWEQSLWSVVGWCGCPGGPPEGTLPPEEA